MKKLLKAIIILFTVTLVPLYSQEILMVPEDYLTIQEAVDSARPGDTVLISEGEFYGHTLITKPLTIMGAGKENTLLYYYDETSPRGLAPGIINYAKIAVPVLKIDTSGKVIIRDLEVRGAREGFSHMGTTPFGIISYNSNLELYNLNLRYLRNIGVWVDYGSLIVADIDFADDLGYLYQTDLGFHLSNLSQADFIRLNQLQDNIDHTINIKNDKDWDNPNTIINIKDSTIVASALFWGDCIRSYGFSDISISNTKLYRNDGGEPEGDTGVGNTGISLNGHSTNLYIFNTSFKNLPRGINLYTSIYGEQFYKVIIENSSFDTFDKSAIYVTGKGKADIDLGGGQLGSGGNNTFLPENSEIVINKDNSELNIYYPEQSLDLISSEKITYSTEEIQISGSKIQLVKNGKIIESADLNHLIPVKAVMYNEMILASYYYPDGDFYLGQFNKKFEFLYVYNMGTLEIIDFMTDGDIILCHYKTDEGLNYIGTFSASLSFLGDYWFYSTVTIFESYLEDGEVRVIYGHENGEKFTGYFSNEMKYLKSKSVD